MGPGRISQSDAPGRTTPALSKVGIVCALRTEARHFRRAGPASDSVIPLRGGVLLSVCGMGPAAAAAGTWALITAGVQAILSWGFAGGLDPALRPGAVLLPAEILDTVGARVLVSNGWRRRLVEHIGPRYGISSGALLTSPRSVGTVAAKAQLFKATRAVAVDMESFISAQISQERSMPFAALRVILDAAHDELPAAIIRAADQYGELQPARLLSELLRTPADLPALLRLGGRFHRANRTLATLAGVTLQAAAAAAQDIPRT